MALQVWLMRHGEAADPDTASSDEQRALTERGRRQVAAMGTWLSARVEPPELILHSPLRRARETAQSLAEALGSVPVMVETALGPGMRGNTLLTYLQQQGMSRVACIGHQPDIGQCLSTWIGETRAQIAPGTLAIVHFANGSVTGALRALVDPTWFSDR